MQKKKCVDLFISLLFKIFILRMLGSRELHHPSPSAAFPEPLSSPPAPNYAAVSELTTRWQQELESLWQRSISLYRALTALKQSDAKPRKHRAVFKTWRVSKRLEAT